MQTYPMIKQFVNNVGTVRFAHYLRSSMFVPANQNLTKPKKKENKSVSSSIMENNGFIADSATGLLTHLPLGKRVLNKLTNIVREEMNAINGQEIDMPALSYLDLWNLTGRTELMGQELFQLTDRHNKKLCLCPTHEEIVTQLVAHHSKMISSNCIGDEKSLLLYQITKKYRDESRPKHTLLRAREFLMKDMYTFHTNELSAESTYEKVCRAYETLFDRLDLSFIRADASVGAMGGRKSNEYHIESEIGEDKIFSCPKCQKSISIDLVEADALKENDQIEAKQLCEIIGCNHLVDDTTLIKPKRCIEIGHTFLLGDRYTKHFPIHVKQKNGDLLNSAVTMGCYGIGVSRIMQACVESRHINKTYPDWPLDIAPFQIAIIPAKDGSKFENKSKKLVNYLYEMLDTNPVFKDDVLIDDRTGMTIGSRIIDAKLAGIPFVIALGKCIEEEQVEIVINSTSIERDLKKSTMYCHSRETGHVLKQLKNDYFYARKQKKLEAYFN